MTDPIADMFNRIKNAEMVQQQKVVIPYSRIKFELAEILKNNNFITDFKKRGRTVKKNIIIDLKYDEEKQPAMAQFKRVSKSGQRVYRKYKEIKRVRSGFGISIISTSKGIMTGQEARKKKLGGEVLIEMW